MTVLVGEEIITEYTSRGDRYENLSPERYLDMIRPYLRDLINHHKPTTKLNNDERRKWEIQLVMQNNFISTKDFKETRIIYSARKPAEVFMGSSNTWHHWYTFWYTFTKISTGNGNIKW